MMIMISGCKDTKISENTLYPNYRKMNDFRKSHLRIFFRKTHLGIFFRKIILEISLLPYPYPSESQPCYPAPILSDDP